MDPIQTSLKICGAQTDSCLPPHCCPNPGKVCPRKGQLWHTQRAESKAQLSNSFWKMVNGGEMPNVAGQDIIAFLFPETEWWKTNPQTNQAVLAGRCSLLLPGTEHEASTAWGFCCGCQLCTDHSALSRTPHAPSEAPGCQICPLPTGAWSLEVRGGILRPSTRKGQAQCWPWAQPIHQSSSGLPPPQITSFPMLIPSEHYADCLYFCTARTGC